jgi:hypothetical protein
MGTYTTTWLRPLPYTVKGKKRLMVIPEERVLLVADFAMGFSLRCDYTRLKPFLFCQIVLVVRRDTQITYFLIDFSSENVT